VLENKLSYSILKRRDNSSAFNHHDHEEVWGFMQSMVINNVILTNCFFSRFKPIDSLLMNPFEESSKDFIVDLIF
jgi:hypothetical protein